MAESPDSKAARHDPWEPRREPAKTLYLAFQAEAAKRKGRSVEEWIAAERKAVWLAALAYAKASGVRQPSLEEVTQAERYAMGSVDYGAKWAYTLEGIMLGTAKPLGLRTTSSRLATR